MPRDIYQGPRFPLPLLCGVLPLPDKGRSKKRPEGNKTVFLLSSRFGKWIHIVIFFFLNRKEEFYLSPKYRGYCLWVAPLEMSRTRVAIVIELLLDVNHVSAGIVVLPRVTFSKIPYVTKLRNPWPRVVISLTGPPCSDSIMQNPIHPDQEPAYTKSQQQSQHQVNLLLSYIVSDKVILWWVHHWLVSIVRDDIVNMVPSTVAVTNPIFPS